MTVSIILASIAVFNTFLDITNANPQNGYASSYEQNPIDPDAAYNNHNNRHRRQISNFANGDNKRNVINVGETDSGYSVSTYERDRIDRPSVTNYNDNFDEPPRNNDRLEVKERSQSTFNQDERSYEGSFQSQDPVNRILLDARIGTGINNDNEIYVNGIRINPNPNQADNHANGGAGVNRYPDTPTQYPYNSGSGLQNRYNGGTNYNQNTGTPYSQPTGGQYGNNADNHHNRAGVPNVPGDTIPALQESTGSVYNYGRGVDNKNIINIETDQNTYDERKLNDRERGNFPDNHANGGAVVNRSPVTPPQYPYNGGSGLENRYNGGTNYNQNTGTPYSQPTGGQYGNNADNYHNRAGVPNVPGDTIPALQESTGSVYNYGRGVDNKNIINIETAQNTDDERRLNDRERGNFPDNHANGGAVVNRSPVTPPQYPYNGGSGLQNRYNGETNYNQNTGTPYSQPTGGQYGNNAGNYQPRAEHENEPDDIISTLEDSTRFAYNYGNGINNKNIISIDNVQYTDDGWRLNNRQRGFFSGDKNYDCGNIFDDESLKVLPHNPYIL